MVTQVEAIKNFLVMKTHSDLASMYSECMEVQVNVAADDGTRIEDVFKGHKWHGYTDGIQTWKSFRIPRNAKTNPEYGMDTTMAYDLVKHAEGIGMTGWDWVNKKSRWVAYDFDAMTGHSEKHDKRLSDSDLEAIKNAVSNIPWVTVRKSTGGKGLHLYVFLDGIDTENHSEHAALARAILGMIVALTGYDFQSKVDICGGNMWVWHRKMSTANDGLQLIKSGDVLKDIPMNWRDHINVVSGKRKRVVPDFIAKEQSELVEKMFEELSGQRSRTSLDETHLKLMSYLKDNGHYWTFDQDNNMLITHTYSLKCAHTDLGFKGVFETLAEGSEKGVDKNCFLFPMRNGAWSVRRYSPGVAEAPTWEQDGQGWTMSYFNIDADLKTASRFHNGLEDDDGSFIFRTAESAAKAALMLGINATFDPLLRDREAALKEGKDGRIRFSIKCDDNMVASDKMSGWLPKKGKVQKLFKPRSVAKVEAESGNYDEVVRHLITTSREDFGWVSKNSDGWNNEPLNHIRIYLQSLNLSPNDINRILGSAIINCWTVTNKPFQPEYPGDRKWNKEGAQLRFTPSQNVDSLSYPNWLSVLKHCGAGLDSAVKENVWCKANGILNGADYLKCWVASLLQRPLEPLPYLFLYSYGQNTGKSIFHEALSLLINRGVARADNALTNNSSFNGELANAVLCVVEETDLQRNKLAYNRIKDWVTARQIPIHRKHETPITIDNTTHWIQCANDDAYCPIFPGDTRITMIKVEPLSPLEMIPKTELLTLLEKEAADFLAEVLSLELPKSNDRLGIPVIETQEKTSAAMANRSELQTFVDDCCFEDIGNSITFAEFDAAFKKWLDPNEAYKWSKIKVGKEIVKYYSGQYPKGRSTKDGTHCIGNISLTKPEKESGKPKYVVHDDKLVHYTQGS